MATPVGRARSHLDASGSSRQPVLSDDLLLEIFLRIGCPDDLTRASVACVAFRRLITDPTFLLRYQNHHKPVLLGFLSPEGFHFHPVEAPRPNTPAARALSNISFDYLPQDELINYGRYIRDVRDGRVLFIDCSDDSVDQWTFVVCDPLSRRRLKLPPMPHYGQGQADHLEDYNATFAPCADEKSFRVIGEMHYETKFVVSVFDSGSGSWSLGTCSSWKALVRLRDQPWERPLLLDSGYAYGCRYWKIYGENKLLKLDINRMKLSTVDLSPVLEYNVWHLVVVEAEKHRLGMFSCNPKENLWTITVAAVSRIVRIREPMSGR